MKQKNYFFILLCFIMLSYANGCNFIEFRSPEVKDGKLYGMTEGLFMHQWWNYYERGLSFADGGFFEKAESDLKEAIRQQKNDEWRVRTYGMHFVDYFPHCELGVIRFKQGDLDTAIAELTTALETAKNAKAEFYLDLARKTLIEKEQSDKLPPEIIIQSPRSVSPVKDFSIEIKGTAKDDQFVRHITVNGKNIRIDVSDKTIDFYMKVPVHPGENRIPVVAIDLTGKESQTEVIVHVDRMGPLVSIDETFEQTSDSEQGILLKGYAYDDSGIFQVKINGKKIPYNGETEVQFQEMITPESAKETVIEVTDQPGNVTLAKTDLAETLKAERSRLVAENMTSEQMVLSDNQMLAQISPPIIELHNKDLHRITYSDHVVIDGEVSSESGEVKSLVINNKELLKTPRKNYYFNYLIELGEDEKEKNINILAIDTLELSSPKEIKIERRIPEALKRKSRLKIIVNDFKRNKKGLNDSFEGDLAKFMRSQKRFYKSVQSSLDPDEDNACKKAKEKGYDFILFGRIVKREDNSTHINVWVSDKDDCVPIVDNIDIYADGVYGFNQLKLLPQMMNYKLTDELPLVKGNVEEIDKKEITVNIGKKEKVKEGMPLLVYETAPHDDTLGEAKIKTVVENKESESEADVLDKKPNKDIKKGHYVITR